LVGRALYRGVFMRGLHFLFMVVLLDQLGLCERQSEAVRLHLQSKTQVQIAQTMNISQAAVSQLLARAQAKAAAQGITLIHRQRTIRPNSPFRR